MKIAILPSNQHLNPYAGLPGVTEERWAVGTCNWLKRKLWEYGAETRIFHLAGTGASSVDELSIMIREAADWNPDYMLSVHSDAVGDARQTGILMLMARERDRAQGEVLGRNIAAHVGLPYKATWVYGQEARRILYLRTLRERNLEGSLVEVGEHATRPEATWNWEHQRQIGEGIADALAEHLGLEEDDMSQEQYEKLLKSAQAQSFVNAIANALLIGDRDKAKELNDEFYVQFPAGDSGLPKDWEP